MKLLLALSLPLYVADQVTKALVLRAIAPEEVIPVIPDFFNLVHVHNTGAAFGILKNNNTFFIGISAIALVVLAVLWWRGSFCDRPSRVAAAMLLAGIAGNLTDRILHGHVVDFLQFFLPIYGEWPSFNVADACICLAAGLFLVSAFFAKPERPGDQGSSR